MSREHFCGTWQITKCYMNEKLETVGLEGIKFRLDKLGDITWYNDLAHLTAATCREDFNDISESADVLFSCETFEVQARKAGSLPGLLFGACAGYSILFEVDSLKPDIFMYLCCEGWYTLLCQRVEPEHQSTGQDSPFSLLGALDDPTFSDGLIESAEGYQLYIHSSIMRLNGFDATSCPQPAHTITTTNSLDKQQSSTTTDPNSSTAAATTTTTTSPSEIRIAIIPPTTPSSSDRTRSSSFLLSPKLLISPTFEMFHLPSKLASNLSNSFNCLSASIKQQQQQLQQPSDTGDPFTLHRNTISTSDSNLKSSLNPNNNASSTRHNIFTFAGDFVYRQPKGCPPLSPYRSKSPLWSSTTGTADTPPPSPLTPAEVLQTLPMTLLRPICHWLYAECLPAGLDEDTLNQLIEFTDGMSRLSKLTELCHSYLQMVRLRKLVINIVTDAHNCFNRIIEKLNPANVSHEPQSLWSSCKFCLREVAFACTKVLQFCNIFVKDSHNMSRQQRHEIIKYVRSRLPVFLGQAHQLLQNILCILLSLSANDKMDLVEFLVPEIESALALVTDIVTEIKKSLHDMYDDLRNEYCPTTAENHHNKHWGSERGKKGATASANSTSSRRPSQFDIPMFNQSTKNLKFVLYIYELKKMKDVYGRISTALVVVEEKRTAYNEMTVAHKQQTIQQNLEQLIALIPELIEKIEYFSNNLEDLNGWKEFKFFFKLATNQINGVISKLLDHRSALNEAMIRICLLIGKRPFTSTLVEMGLLDSRKIVLGQLEDYPPSSSSNSATPQNVQQMHKLNLTRHCCEPPSHGNSVLSKNALRLLHSGQFSDMEFEIVVVPPCTDFSLVDSNRKSSTADGVVETGGPVQVHVFRAHRVIVATRCEWFRKALSSGMKESIHRKITIHDTTPVIFRRLLLYLYGAPVDKTVGAEQLCELMLLADRFSVDVLKDICESTLNSLIDDHSVLCLLAIADRLNAAVLKANCFSFISQHAEITKVDLFNDLPKTLQSEVHEVLLWCGRIPEPWRERKPSKKRSHKSSPQSATTTAGTTT